MLKKIFFLLFLIFAPFTFAGAQDNSNFPQGDFRLDYGYANINWDEAEKMTGYAIRDTQVFIKSGKVTANNTKSINFSMPNDQDYTGTITLSLTGDYDKDTGYLYGEAEMTSDIKTVKHMAVEDFNGEWKDTLNGKFVGYVVRDQAVVKLTLKGNENAWMEKALGEIDRRDSAMSRNYKIAYQVVAEKGASADTAPVSEVDKIFLDENGKPLDSGTRVSAVTGEVEIHIPGEPENSWHLLKMETKIPAGARIRTAEDSTIILSFDDMSTVTLKSESDVYVTTAPKESKLKLIAGSIYLNIKKMAVDNTMDIEMNQAVAGIKGTTLMCSQTSEGSKIKVYDGSVGVKNNKTNEETMVAGGNEILIDTTGKSQIAKIQGADEQIGERYKDVDCNKIDQLTIGGGNNTTQPNQATEDANQKKPKTNIYIGLGILLILVVIGIGIKMKKNN